MEIGVLGVNHKSCSLFLREKLTGAFEKIFKESPPFLEGSYVLLSTCNRVEIYFTAQEVVSWHGAILALLRKHMELSFQHVLYSYFGEDVFSHLVKVTCGLDSALVGESDIQRQVKLAYETTRVKQRLTSLLHYVFQKSLKVSKEMRSFYSYAKRGRHLEEVILSQVKAFLGDPPSGKVLFIGNSQMNRQILALFANRPFQELTLCSRRGTDKELMQKYPQLKMQAGCQGWQAYDIIISATKCEDYVLKHTKIGPARKMVIFDLSVPRSVDPALKQMPGIFLLNMENLGVFFEEKKRIYQEELAACEQAIERAIQSHAKRYKEKQGGRLVYQDLEGRRV